MTTGDAILQAIIADPEDITSRLVYADWLDEHGDQLDHLRAEFIRAQCRIADMPACLAPGKVGTCPHCKEIERLARREQEILDTRISPLIDVPNWMTGRPTLEQFWRWQTFGIHASLGWRALEFRRGFVEVVNLSAEEWFRCGPELVQQTPLCEVSLANMMPQEIRLVDGRLVWVFPRDLATVEHWRDDLLSTLYLYYKSAASAQKTMNRDLLAHARNKALQLKETT